MHRVEKMVPTLPVLRRAAICAGAVTLALVAAGCRMNSGPDHTGAVPLGYEQRHPVTVGYKPVDIIIYADPYAGGLSAQDATQVAALARQYRNSGHGTIYLQAPSGSGADSAVHSASTQIRQILAREGVEPSLLTVHTYRADGSQGPAPMKLVFYRYSAEAGPCGNWPDSMTHNPSNAEYENFGCTSQRNLAAMVEDPRDLLGPRGDGPRDAMRRTTVQDKYRRGEDPATVYNEDGTQISEVGQQ